MGDEEKAKAIETFASPLVIVEEPAMALVNKPVTPRLAKANRTNSEKSTGPRTVAGKNRSSRNSLKSGVHSNPLLAMARGEDIGDFEGIHKDLSLAFGPSDKFEQMLVEDMAVLRWRRLRLLCAESDLRDSHVLSPIERSVLAAGRRVAADQSLVPILTNEEVLSLVHKFDATYDRKLVRLGTLSHPARATGSLMVLTLLLRALRIEFSTFDDATLDRLRALYGPEPPQAGKALLAAFEDYGRQERTADDTKRKENREAFVAALDEEVAFYIRLWSLVDEMFPDWRLGTGGPGVLTGEEMDKIMRYEAHLERQFERKLQQLVSWRRAKGESTHAAGGLG